MSNFEFTAYCMGTIVGIGCTWGFGTAAAMVGLVVTVILRLLLGVGK